LPKKSELIAGFAWASVCVIPWLWILNRIPFSAGSIFAVIFFLVIAIMASMYQAGTEIKRKL
jgi:hypothetical protein